MLLNKYNSEILKKVRSIANNTSYLPDRDIDELVNFEFSGITIFNPWTNENVTKLFTDEEAIEYYGKDNIETFIDKVIEKYHLN